MGLSSLLTIELYCYSN